MQEGMNSGPSERDRWSLRLTLWRSYGDGIGAALATLGQWLVMRKVFAVTDAVAFWEIAIINAAMVVFLVARAHVRVERLLRAASPMQTMPASGGAYRTAASAGPPGRACSACAPMPAPDMVRREVVAPMVGTTAAELRAEMDARHAALAPLNVEEMRLMGAVFAQRCVLVGAFVPRDESPKDAPDDA